MFHVYVTVEIARKRDVPISPGLKCIQNCPFERVRVQLVLCPGRSTQSGNDVAEQSV